MNRNWTRTAFVAFFIVGLTAGCSSPGNPNPGQASNTGGSTPNSTTGVVNQTTQSSTNSAGSSGNTSNSTLGSTQLLDTASMNKIASGLIERYIQSHNDVTMAKYKSDVQEIFYPGLADFIIMSARPGIDYDHLIKSHTTVLLGVNSTDPKSFTAGATLVLHFQSGETQTHHYQFMFALGSAGNWTIQSLRGA